MLIQKVLFTLGLIFLALVCLSPLEVRAATCTQTIDDTTVVYPWFQDDRKANSSWTDIIAPDPLNWDIDRVKVTWDTNAETVTLEIFTNYPLTGGTGGTADIWLQNNGEVAGILLHDGENNAQLVTGITWESSRTTTVPDEWSNGSYYYGGEYAPQGTPEGTYGEVPLSYIQSFNNILDDDVTVTVFEQNQDSDTAYIIQLAFALNAGGYDWRDFDFTVMSGTCANEVLFGQAAAVPIPGSGSLLGMGLVGLGVVTYRRRRAR